MMPTLAADTTVQDKENVLVGRPTGARTPERPKGAKFVGSPVDANSGRRALGVAALPQSPSFQSASGPTGCVDEVLPPMDGCSPQSGVPSMPNLVLPVPGRASLTSNGSNDADSCIDMAEVCDDDDLPTDSEELQLRIRKMESVLINERENAAQYEQYALKMQEEKQTLFRYYEAKCNRVKEQANQLKEAKAKDDMMSELLLSKVRTTCKPHAYA